ncbi:MAG: DUF427 domain-containing protein [Pseudomonadota bacterium]
MPEVIIRPANGTVVVRAGGAVIAESPNAKTLYEDGHEPVYYIPKGDVGMALLEPTGRRADGPHWGEAQVYAIAGKSGPIADAAWSYAAPHDALAEIADHVAFDGSKAAVELL